MNFIPRKLYAKIEKSYLTDFEKKNFKIEIKNF